MLTNYGKLNASKEVPPEWSVILKKLDGDYLETCAMVYCPYVLNGQAMIFYFFFILEGFFGVRAKVHHGMYDICTFALVWRLRLGT